MTVTTMSNNKGWVMRIPGTKGKGEAKKVEPIQEIRPEVDHKFTYYYNMYLSKGDNYEQRI